MVKNRQAYICTHTKKTMVLTCRKIPKINSGSFIFKGSLGGAYVRREICVSKSIGLAYSWKDIYVSNLQKGFTETRLEDVYLFKTPPYKNYTKPRVKSELRKWQYTVTLFDRSYLARVIVIWQIQTFIDYCTVFALFTVYVRAISKYKTTRAYIWRGDLTVVFFLR